MCGIAGFTRFDDLPAADEACLRAMTERLAHRGPDGSGYHRTRQIALGHRRLSIIDLESGAQPMTSPDGRYALTYNGEIYNYLELRAALEAKGVVFTTHSDTEVLLQLGDVRTRLHAHLRVEV